MVPCETYTNFASTIRVGYVRPNFKVITWATDIQQCFFEFYVNILIIEVTLSTSNSHFVSYSTNFTIISFYIWFGIFKRLQSLYNVEHCERARFYCLFLPTALQQHPDSLDRGDAHVRSTCHC